jgi:hypothetical protein
MTAPSPFETVSQCSVLGERQSGSKALERGLLGMGNHRWLKIECLHRVGDPESKRLKVATLNLWEASRYPFDRPLPGKPPNSPDRLSPFPRSRTFHIATQSLEGGGEGEEGYQTFG